MRKVCLALLIVLVCGEFAAADPVGDWLVKDGNASIRIETCANGLWGFISWTQTPGTDSKNPDSAKRSRPLVGIPIIRSMMPVKPNRWEGEVYNAESGKMYSASITLTSADVLRIEGCVLGGLFCGGESWTRIQNTDPKASAAKPKDNRAPIAAKGKETAASQPRICSD